ncbi:MAG TPA: helix-turn-helix transcriptional regulator [Candidatus Eisenbergiella merdavium]|uniref:Helix-turn-helix transcriptional regulator n=1 Tax=Candidatus Eisenbergiella merdavium TaxID=2838551 RepID=A0A9D2NIP2_9FIRM|nr:helix-turn-helix transcriptional regulator [Candidatus Eisenbergiella merdavium]
MLYDNVKVLCAEKNISVGQLEKELGFSNGSVCKWNENEPGIRKVQKVADYLQVPIERLLKESKPVAQ